MVFSPKSRNSHHLRLTVGWSTMMRCVCAARGFGGLHRARPGSEHRAEWVWGVGRGARRGLAALASLALL